MEPVYGRVVGGRALFPDYGKFLVLTERIDNPTYANIPDIPVNKGTGEKFLVPDVSYDIMKIMVDRNTFFSTTLGVADKVVEYEDIARMDIGKEVMLLQTVFLDDFRFYMLAPAGNHRINLGTGFTAEPWVNEKSMAVVDGVWADDPDARHALYQGIEETVKQELNAIRLCSDIEKDQIPFFQNYGYNLMLRLPSAYVSGSDKHRNRKDFVKIFDPVIVD